MSGGGASKQKSEGTSEAKTAEQKSALAKALKAYEQQGRIGAGQKSYTGERIAGFNQAQQDILSGLGTYSDLFSAERSMPLYGETGSALRGILEGETGAELINPEDAARVFEESRAAPQRREFQKYGIPLIEEQYAGPGFLSTARANEVTRAAEDLQQDIAAQRSEFLYQQEQINRQLQEERANRALSAIPLGQQYSQLPTTEALARVAGQQSVFDIASQEQALRQSKIDTAMQKFAEANRFMDPEDFSVLTALLGLNFTSSTQSGSGSSWSIML